MRIYIIGSDGITLCREPPAAVNEGEIAVASSEELHAARLSGKRLLALWNALAGVEKLRKVAGRDALIEQLGSAIESLPDPQSARPAVVGQASVLNQKFVSTLGLDDRGNRAWRRRRTRAADRGNPNSRPRDVRSMRPWRYDESRRSTRRRARNRRARVGAPAWRAAARFHQRRR